MCLFLFFFLSTEVYTDCPILLLQQNRVEVVNHILDHVFFLVMVTKFSCFDLVSLFASHFSVFA